MQCCLCTLSDNTFENLCCFLLTLWVIIVHVNIAEITADVFLQLNWNVIVSDGAAVIKSRFYQTRAEILCDDGLTHSLNGLHFSHYFLLALLSDRRQKICEWEQLHWEFSCINVEYMWERQTLVKRLAQSRMKIRSYAVINMQISIGCHVVTLVTFF